MIKILVVDDEVDICETCVMYLETIGYDVRGAKNSAEAFAALDEYSPDIAILDINLREKYSGIDVLRKGLELYPKMQAIMLTGLKEGKETEESMRVGARMIVKKPITVNVLKDVVEKIAREIESQ